jgi:hypothetical protein
VADIDLPYNTIIGRPAKFLAIPHYTYLAIKIPGPKGVISVKTDLKNIVAYTAIILTAVTEALPEAENDFRLFLIAHRSDPSRLSTTNEVRTKQIPLGVQGDRGSHYSDFFQRYDTAHETSSASLTNSTQAEPP